MCKLQPPNRRIELLAAKNPGTFLLESCEGATDGHKIL